MIKAADEPSGQLTIGASESLMIYWLPNIIMDFMEKYPKVELTLKSIDYDHLSAQLKKGDIDAAVLVETSNWNSKELTIQKIKDEKLSLIQSTKKTNHAFQKPCLLRNTHAACVPLLKII
ncbi:MAG TPA: LysR family transcriptional regulator substrate-binding protein [Bacillus sp. (in: firmicutes)]|nr:LysR family transcriptional regulator substrate-binding protein [Bacillus sp. (in: firmicutes)]